MIPLEISLTLVVQDERPFPGERTRQEWEAFAYQEMDQLVTQPAPERLRYLSTCVGAVWLSGYITAMGITADDLSDDTPPPDCPDPRETQSLALIMSGSLAVGTTREEITSIAAGCLSGIWRSGFYAGSKQRYPREETPQCQHSISAQVTTKPCGPTNPRSTYSQATH